MYVFHGIKPGVKPRPLAERFWKFVDKKRDNECWPWMGGVSTHGYAKFENSHASRWMYKLTNGDPGELVVDHICYNTLCVNPSHLQAITQKQNIHRTRRYLRNRNRTEFECGHPFEASNFVKRINERPWKECKMCANIRNKKRYEH